MGNTGLLRHEAEMTLLQPHLGDTRRQELRNSPFWSSLLSQSRREMASSSKKAPLKMLRVSDPIKISPLVVPTIRKEAPTGNAQSFSSGGNRISEAPRVIFDPTLGGEDMETPPPPQ